METTNEFVQKLQEKQKKDEQKIVTTRSAMILVQSYQRIEINNK